jgi:hypothetical protein
MSNEDGDVLMGLGARRHLDRERSLAELQRTIAAGKRLACRLSCCPSWGVPGAQCKRARATCHAGAGADPKLLADGVLDMLLSDEWEKKLGALMGAKVGTFRDAAPVPTPPFRGLQRAEPTGRSADVREA